MPELAGAAIYNNLEPSARGLVTKVHEYMEEVLWKLTEDVVHAFPRLQAAMKALVNAHTSRLETFVILLLDNILVSMLC